MKKLLLALIMLSGIANVKAALTDDQIRDFLALASQTFDNLTKLPTLDRKAITCRIVKDLLKGDPNLITFVIEVAGVSGGAADTIGDLTPVLTGIISRKMGCGR